MKKPDSKGKISVTRNRKGEIIGYRARICLGRSEDGKQVWRTRTFPRPEGKTPKQEEKEIGRQVDAWEQKEREEYKRTHEKTDKRRIGFSDFVAQKWIPYHVMDGNHTPNGIAFFKASSKSSVEFFKQKRLSDIDPESVKAYVKYLRTEAAGASGKPYSAGTQQHHYATLRNILQYAWRYGYISENPCQRLENKEKPSAGKTTIDFLSPTDAKRFLACLDEEYTASLETGESGTIRKYAFWRLYGYLLILAGLRRGEAVGLKWSDIDHGRMTLTVERSVCSDKTSETKMQIKSTKTGEARVLPILAELYKMMMDYREISERYFGTPLPDDSFIFCSDASPSVPVYCSTPTRYFSKFVKRHGLPNVSPHDLRHTSASLALESGANMKQIAELMGHHDIGVTASFYAALTQEAKRRTVEGIGGLLFERQQNEKILDK